MIPRALMSNKNKRFVDLLCEQPYTHVLYKYLAYVVFGFILSCIHYKHTLSRKTKIKDMEVSLKRVKGHGRCEKNLVVVKTR